MSPIYLSDGENFVPMHEQPYDAEAVLQALLAEHPEILFQTAPSSGGRGWLLIRREAGIADAEDAGNRWSLDHLFLDAAGVPTLVEVKRSSDTRARREVVAQMLDYAANAIHWRAESLVAWLEAESERRGIDSSDALDEAFGITDLDSYWERVQTNLAADRVRLVFVADSISSELRGIVELLNRQMSETEVLALEVKQYVDAHGERQIIVPNLVGRTEAARAAKRPVARAGQSTARPTPETARDWSTGDRCLAYHPRTHPERGLATVMEPFKKDRDSLVLVHFDDWAPGYVQRTHKNNVFTIPDGDLTLASEMPEIGKIVPELGHGTRFLG